MRAIGVDFAAGFSEFTTASAVSAQAVSARRMTTSDALALADNLFATNDLSFLGSLLGGAFSAVEDRLSCLLVQSGSTAPAPLGAELFDWASSFVIGTATSFFGNCVFTARVS